MAAAKFRFVITIINCTLNINFVIIYYNNFTVLLFLTIYNQINTAMVTLFKIFYEILY